MSLHSGNNNSILSTILCCSSSDGYLIDNFFILFMLTPTIIPVKLLLNFFINI